MSGSESLSDQSRNWPLRGLSKAEYERLLPNFEAVTLNPGQIIYRPQELIHDIYFPDTGCVISLLSLMNDGSTVEVGAVGSEGLFGISIFGGVRTTPSALGTIPGNALG